MEMSVDQEWVGLYSNTGSMGRDAVFGESPGVMRVYGSVMTACSEVVGHAIVTRKIVKRFSMWWISKKGTRAGAACSCGMLIWCGGSGKIIGDGGCGSDCWETIGEASCVRWLKELVKIEGYMLLIVVLSLTFILMQLKMIDSKEKLNLSKTVSDMLWSNLYWERDMMIAQWRSGGGCTLHFC